MGFDAFMADPKGYAQHHRIMVADSAPSATSAIAQGPVALANGKHRQEFQIDPAHFITMIHTVRINQNGASTKGEIRKAVVGSAFGVSGSRIVRTFQPIVAGADVGFRYLPFRENQCTYMQLDANAAFWITGPLSGCTVAVVRENGAIWCLHSNDNVGTGVAARTTQLNSLQQTCAAIGLTFANLSVCEYTRDYHGLGFVFGRQRANSWKFYSHAKADNGSTRTIKFADI